MPGPSAGGAGIADQPSRVRRVLRGRLVEDADELETLRDEWDALAEAAARPFAAPGWGLPWLRHAAPPDARLRSVAVLDGERLAGIAPLVAVRSRGLTMLRPLAADVSHRVEPLAAPGEERPVAAAVAAVLAATDSDSLEFTCVAAASPWPELLRELWPGRRPAVVTRQDRPGAGRRDLGPELRRVAHVPRPSFPQEAAARAGATGRGRCVDPARSDAEGGGLGRRRLRPVARGALGGPRRLERRRRARRADARRRRAGA